MFFFTRYPNSNVLKTFFPDVKVRYELHMYESVISVCSPRVTLDSEINHLTKFMIKKRQVIRKLFLMLYLIFIYKE